eukprot:CAMPEP_0198202526 /NCGR_PEP_ID=MMETSP1445-20131203/5699_1 /TAXON_ID=36898 /ORGANISM="Pyramimonas sp., Strain CCMP2087" /LENGTH=528 /DNA_ID=CAMNT_0043873493 /DNA_START=241 /DNA_END=1827 /DNA_ORIENTATION=-
MRSGAKVRSGGEQSSNDWSSARGHRANKLLSQPTASPTRERSFDSKKQVQEPRRSFDSKRQGSQSDRIDRQGVQYQRSMHLSPVPNSGPANELGKRALQPIPRVPYISQPTVPRDFSDAHRSSFPYRQVKPASIKGRRSLESGIHDAPLPRTKAVAKPANDRPWMQFTLPQPYVQEHTGLEYDMGKHILNKADTQKNRFGSNLTHHVLVDTWLSSFTSDDRETFSSDLLYLETKLADGLAMTDGWKQPNRLSTVVACACFDIVIRRLSSHQSVLNTIRSVLYQSIFQNYTKLGSPPSSQLMPSWLIDAETWYEDQDADMSKIPKIERKINNLETQVQKEQDRYQKMLSIVLKWQWGVVRSYFQNWRDNVEEFHKKKKTLSSFIVRWADKGPDIGETFNAWYYLFVQTKMENNRENQNQYQRVITKHEEELAYLRAKQDEQAKQIYDVMKENQQFVATLKQVQRKLEEEEKGLALEGQSVSVQSTAKNGDEPLHTKLLAQHKESLSNIRRVIATNAPDSVADYFKQDLA